MEKQLKNQILENLILKLDYKKLKLSILQKDINEVRTVRLLKNIIDDENILDIIDIIDNGIGFNLNSPEDLYMDSLALVDEINELYQEINELDKDYYYFIGTLEEKDKLAFLNMTDIEKKEFRDSKTVIDIRNDITKQRMYDTVASVKRRQLNNKKKTKLGKIVDILRDK